MPAMPGGLDRDDAAVKGVGKITLDRLVTGGGKTGEQDFLAALHQRADQRGDRAHFADRRRMYPDTGVVVSRRS